jgi:rubrerythrin
MTPAQLKVLAQVGAVLALLGLAYAALYGAYRHGVTVTDTRWQAAWANAEAKLQGQKADALQAARDEEQRRQTLANQVAKDARDQKATAAADAVGADAAGERLHVEAAKLAAGAGKCTSNTGATDRSEAATRAAMVLSDLFQRADKRAGEVAVAYDKARIAGMACERAYIGLAHKIVH